MLKITLNKISELLENIYGHNLEDGAKNRILDLIRNNEPINKKSGKRWDESDLVLITYGDSIKRENRSNPLKTLNIFLNNYLDEFISSVHILPFFPYSSDYGFSVKNYTQVYPVLGSWKDIKNIGQHFKLMFDLVINHVSVQHIWFQNFLEGKSPGKDYFIVKDKDKDLSEVVRPRSSPLLTPFDTVEGKKYVWTTFSDDQADLDFSNPQVLHEMLKILHHYLEKGADYIRLDAIAYLWKEDGTKCIHLPQTHEIVKLIRVFAEYFNPEVVIITETNVPHEENISYFGKGDEAQMVYQFPIPPLLLYTLHSGNAEYLKNWSKSLGNTPEGTTFFNFTASHDGIGVRPLEGLLPQDEFDQLIENMKNAGGKISTKQNQDGSESPYEINISYFDALSRTRQGKDNFQAKRFICSQAIMLALKGVPAFYIHSLTSTPNDYEKMKKSGIKRDINRKNWDFHELTQLLRGETIHSAIFNELKRISIIRAAHPAFHPDSGQQVIDSNNNLFALKRTAESEEILAIYNISPLESKLELKDLRMPQGKKFIDLLNTENIYQDTVILAPYQNIWLTEKP
jgi:sucrose phosphorylase